MNVDWLGLWQKLVVTNARGSSIESMKRYRSHARQKRQRPDPLLDFVIESTGSKETVLDIGSGDGRWTIPLAGKAGAVTAVEPDKEMLKLLRENADAAKVNIRIVELPWEEAGVEPHDIVVCAHAMYTTPDLAAFVRRMEQHARKTCYLAVRLPPVDGIIGELMKEIHGATHDSANAVIAFNALYSMGIYANVMVENNIHSWVNDTFEEAFTRAKKHLRMTFSEQYDELIRDTLNKRLTFSDGLYIWPDGMRSALLWWNPANPAVK
jgi:FkbM family methyltransferase